jgi:hypothetical protein
MKRFLIQKNGQDVLGGAVGEDNVYIATYGSVEPGRKQPADLDVDETTLKTYALSGQKPTTYTITRIE